jgi:hypothetical protein
MSPARLAFYAMGFMLVIGSAAAADRPEPPLSAKALKLLEGRTAGKPVNCLSLPRIGSSTIVDQTAIIYKVSNKLWYVNRPSGGSCSALLPDRTLVTHLSMNQLCDLDIVHVVDLQGPAMEYGSCGLGKFVPYGK